MSSSRLLRIATTGLALGLPLSARSDTDQMRLLFVLRDNTVHRVSSPQILLDMPGAEPIPLSDDGSVADDEPGDSVYYAEIHIRRVPELGFTLADASDGSVLGQRTLFLPAAGEARIEMHTDEGDPAFYLDDEGGVSTTGSGSAPATVGTSSASPPDRLAWVIWFATLSALLSLAWLRVKLGRIYHRDLLPTWRRLDTWLQGELGRTPREPAHPPRSRQHNHDH